jgi:hypothetical protein
MVEKISTGERLMRLETQVTGIKDSLEEHKHEQRQDFDKILNKLDDLDGKFANKWVEKVIVGALIAGLGTIISAIIYFI